MQASMSRGMVSLEVVEVATPVPVISVDYFVAMVNSRPVSDTPRSLDMCSQLIRMHSAPCLGV